MVKIFIGVLIGIFLTLAIIQIWNLFTKSSSTTAPNTQQSQIIQSSPSPSTSPVPSPPAVQDYASFIAYVKSLGLGVGSETKAYSNIYSGDITEVLINGETMYVIEYATEEEMNQRASEISPDASSVTKTLPDGTKRMTSFIQIANMPTHYYKKGKIIVIYAGKNESMVQILEEIFGPQFAGHD